MPKGYWIVSLDVSDPEKYKDYLAANVEAFKKFGARHLVRAGKFENPEGTSRSRNVVVEFPTFQAAHDCYLLAGISESDLIPQTGFHR